MSAFMISVQYDFTRFLFTRRKTFCWSFQTMIGRVPDHMGKRIFNKLQNLAVQFGFCAMHDKINFLVQIMAEIADNTRKFRPGISNWLHPGLHQTFLQFRCYMAKALEWNSKFVVIHPANHLEKLVSCQDKFTDHCHQIFKQFDINANTLIGQRCFFGGTFRGCLCFLLRRNNFRRRFFRGFNGFCHFRLICRFTFGARGRIKCRLQFGFRNLTYLQFFFFSNRCCICCFFRSGRTVKGCLKLCLRNFSYF